MNPSIGQDILEQIRAANDIVELVQSMNVPLKKTGATFKALCPFHKEKTPSFMVNPQRQSFHCFGCGTGGDIFKFVMLREGLGFMEAVRRLAERGRVQLPSRFQWEKEGVSEKKKKLYDLHEKALLWFHENLMRSRAGEEARNYLKKREFGSSIAKAFRLGYALPAWDGFLSWARKEGWEPPFLEEAGLVIKGHKGWYDRFRDRLMIPIADEQGRVAGFSGRLLAAEVKEAKYVNTPETLIFKKGRLFFGLHLSKTHLLEEKVALVCEGQFDWIRCYTAGIKNLVAPQGTALTEEQARILSRYVETAILCFDADEAGRSATWRHAETLIAAGLSVRAVRMPQGEDPDSFVKKVGAEAMKKLVSEAVDVFEHKARFLAASLDMRDPINHRRVVREMLPLLSRVDNEPQCQRIIQNVSEILKMDAAAFLAEFHRHRQKPGSAKQIPSPLDEKQPPSSITLNSGNYLLRLALTEKNAARSLVGHLEESWLADYALRKTLFHVIQQSAEGRWKPGWEGLNLDLDDAERQQIALLLTHPQEGDFRSMAVGIQETVSVLHRNHLRKKCEEITKRLRETGLGIEEQLRLLNEQHAIQKELLDLKRTA